MTIKNVAILGAGLMGCGIAQVFLSSEDLVVTLYDIDFKVDPVERIKGNLEILKTKEAIDEQTMIQMLGRIHVTNDLEKALSNADFVIECVFENMEIKQNLFRDIEPLCKEDTIFATNTSVMSITEISAKAINKERIVGTHFWNPPYLIPLVEVVRSNYTSDQVMDQTIELLKKVNKHPIRVNKDVPGFVANRLQHALWREALSIVERGIADPATVDEALRYGPGLRWPIMGVLENADMIGLDLSLDIQKYIVEYLEDSHEPSRLLQQLVEKGDLGFKTGKGYQTWTKEQMDESNKRLREYLIEVTKDLK